LWILWARTCAGGGRALRALLFLPAPVQAEGPFLLTARRLSAILAPVKLTLILLLRYAQTHIFFLALLVPVLILGGCAFQLRQSTNDAPASPSPAPASDVASLTLTPVDAAVRSPLLLTTLTPDPTVLPSATARATSTHTPTIAPSPTTSATGTHTPTLQPAPAATPGPTPDGVARKLDVPILMYHYISRPPAGSDVYRRDLSVTPEQFAEHMRYLRDAGYTTVTLDDLLDALTQGRRLPAKPVVLTFDDGYVDNYTNAFPILRENGFVGTFFIMTDLVTDEAPGYMTWPQVEEMSAAGQRFGSHGRQDHRGLSGRSKEYLVWVALGSKEAIEEHLGYHPRWVAYPSGEYDDQTIAVFRSAGYWGGVTILQGTEHSLGDIFELRRIRVRGSHSASDLAGLLKLKW
jgi:peptidoglycan/xylan/chitin deacetylase (PgdA/CDA1 family)